MSAPLTSLKVSCLLVNYFGAATLAKALQSVFVQQLSNASVQIELDVVVVDNSVDAQEAQLLQNTIAALQSQAVKPLSVQLILNPSNTGVVCVCIACVILSHNGRHDDYEGLQTRQNRPGSL
jgi:glycosyltransferase involved in cell wall biosynthesis